MKLARDFGYISGQMGILSLFHLILMAWIARVLGPEAVGIYGLTISIVQIFLCLLLYGLQPAAAKFIPEYLVNKEDNNLAALILNLYFFRFCLGLISALILYLGRNFISNFYKFEILGEALGYGAILLFLYGLFYLTASCLQGFQKFKEIFILQSIFALATLLITFIFFKQDHSVLAPLKGTAVGLAVSTLYGLTVIILSLSSETWKKVRLEFLLRQGRGLLIYAFPAGLSLVFVLLIDNMGNLIVAKFLPAVTVGYFAFSYRLANYFSKTNSIWEMLFLPKFSELFSRKRRDYLANLFLNLLRNLFFVNTAVVGAALIFSPYLIRLLAGEKFLPALTLFQIFVVINIVRGMNPAINSLYYTYNRTAFLARVSFVKCLLDVTLLLLIIPRFGVVPGALAVLFSWVLVFYYNLYLVGKAVPDLFFAGKASFAFLVAAVVCLCLIPVFYKGVVGIISMAMIVAIGSVLFLKEREKFFLLLKSI